MENLIKAKSETINNAAIVAESDLFESVRAISHSGDAHAAVVGINDNQSPTAGSGVYGKSKAAGVFGESETWHGVAGISDSVTGGAGIYGKSKGAGAIGESETWHGVAGLSKSSTGGAGIYGQNPNGNAGQFDGNVFIKGNLTATGDILLSNADFAEDFDILDDAVEAGTVMVLSTDGGLRKSSNAYDNKVAGVISGAGIYKPGIVLDRQQYKTERKPLAMVGKVYCKVDANYAPIEIGDLLTSSDTSGHAMKASDHVKAFGAIIGKALGTLASGTGLIPILVSVQ